MPARKRTKTCVGCGIKTVRLRRDLCLRCFREWRGHMIKIHRLKSTPRGVVKVRTPRVVLFFDGSKREVEKGDWLIINQLGWPEKLIYGGKNSYNRTPEGYVRLEYDGDLIGHIPRI